MIERFDAIRSLVGGEISLHGEKVFYRSGQTPPSDAEIDTEIIRLGKEYSDNEYARNRQAEYPSIPDQLDEIYHNGIDSWRALIKVTKDKFPKG